MRNGERIPRVARRLALAFVLVAAGCDFVAIRQGRVVGCDDHKPIADAMIDMRDRESPDRITHAESKPDGSYVVAVPGGGDMYQVVSARGFRPDARDLPREPETPIDVCLQRGSP